MAAYGTRRRTGPASRRCLPLCSYAMSSTDICFAPLCSYAISSTDICNDPTPCTVLTYAMLLRHVHA
eukprot:2592857-Rhodomonas_salina.3